MTITRKPEAALESVRLSVADREDLTVDADRYGRTNIGDVGEDSALRNTVQGDPGTRERYTLTRVHGKGGLGQVWLATDRQLNREVALKEVLPNLSQDQEALLRLQKKAQITGQLEHPNIITVYELVEDKETEQSYYTMRFVRGETLRKALKNYHRRRAEGIEDPLELQRLLNAFVSVCNAIGYAHSRGVLHRDLKPANIMLGEFGEVTMLDWGIAMTRDRRESDIDWREVLVSGVDDLQKTAAGHIIGSPAYMSPEQADGDKDQRDRWAVADQGYSRDSFAHSRQVEHDRRPSHVESVVCTAEKKHHLIAQQLVNTDRQRPDQKR